MFIRFSTEVCALIMHTLSIKILEINAQKSALRCWRFNCIA